MYAASAKRAKILEELELFEQKVKADRESLTRRADSAQQTLQSLEQKKADALEDREEAQNRKTGTQGVHEAQPTQQSGFSADFKMHLQKHYGQLFKMGRKPNLGLAQKLAHRTRARIQHAVSS